MSWLITASANADAMGRRERDTAATGPRAEFRADETPRKRKRDRVGGLRWEGIGWDSERSRG